MPSIGNMLEFVDLLQVKPLGGQSLHCVAVRNRNSKCRKCKDVCINDAITIGSNEVNIDLEKCVNCGCCVAACPTHALFTANLSAQELVDKVLQTADRSSGMAIIACSRKAAKRLGDPDKYAEVPCLGYVSEEILFELIARGLDDIVLVDGDCATCVYRKASPHIDEAVENTANMAEAAAVETVIMRSSEFPPEVVDQAQTSSRGKDRRGILKQTGSYVKAVATNVAEKTINEKAGTKSEAFAVNLTLPTGKRGMFPTFEPTFNYRLLDAFEVASQNIEEAIAAGKTFTGRHFGEVVIDEEKCSGCGMCITFCPTGALKYSELEEHPDETMRYLEFQSADCTQCNLCHDVCLRDAIEVRKEVSLASLYDFEPKLIAIKRPQGSNMLSDLKRRLKH